MMLVDNTVMAYENVKRFRITGVAEIGRFITGGLATFTLRDTNARFRATYIIKSDPLTPIYWVGWLRSPDMDLHQGVYLGYMKRSPMVFKITGKSKMVGSRSSELFKRFMNNNANPDEVGIEVYFEGRCGRCGRYLSAEESLSSGFGPECIKYIPRLPELE